MPPFKGPNSPELEWGRCKFVRAGETIAVEHPAYAIEHRGIARGVHILKELERLQLEASEEADAGQIAVDHQARTINIFERSDGLELPVLVCQEASRIRTAQVIEPLSEGYSVTWEVPKERRF